MTLTVVLLTVGLVLAGQPGADAVRDAEARRVRALVTADYAALELLLADDLTYTHSNARVDSKAAYLAPLLSGRTRYTSLQPEDIQVRSYGTTAIVTGTMRSVALVAGKESRVHMRFTSVWVEREGRWRMAAWQSTRLPEP